MSGPTKGMVAGKPIQTDALTKEYAEGHERTFGERPAFPRGRRFVWSATEKRLVPWSPDMERRALDAPICVDRFYENTKTTEGVDIGSRRKHRDYMKATGLTTADDFKETWKRETELRKRIATEGILPDKTRREDVARALHKHRPE